jgi:hypothetical protein
MHEDPKSRIVQVLRDSPVVSYVLDSDLRLIYCNPAWDKFARENGAPGLTAASAVGKSLLQAIPEVLRPAYSEAFADVQRTGNVWERSYECSSPDVFRVFRMRIHLLKPENWFLVTNSLVMERPHENAADWGAHTYFDGHGRVTICAHCRCSRRTDKPDLWDFVPEHLELGWGEPIKVSHGLCPVCRVYFYPFG